MPQTRVAHSGGKTFSNLLPLIEASPMWLFIRETRPWCGKTSGLMRFRLIHTHVHFLMPSLKISQLETSMGAKISMKPFSYPYPCKPMINCDISSRSQPMLVTRWMKLRKISGAMPGDLMSTRPKITTDSISEMYQLIKLLNGSGNLLPQWKSKSLGGCFFLIGLTQGICSREEATILETTMDASSVVVMMKKHLNIWSFTAHSASLAGTLCISTGLHEKIDYFGFRKPNLLGTTHYSWRSSYMPLGACGKKGITNIFEALLPLSAHGQQGSEKNSLSLFIGPRRDTEGLSPLS